MSELSRLTWSPARGGPVSACVPVHDESRIGEARRAAEQVARDGDLTEAERGLVSLIATEAATNLARHAREGSMLVRSTASAGAPGVEILTIDRGPGMHDLARHFDDGFSTGGTSGAGLGAIRRQAHALDVHSVAGKGTALVARVFAGGRDAAASVPRVVDIGVVCRPMDGETVCGDGWSVIQDDQRALALVVDGLGHGPHAAEAADVALRRFESLARDHSVREIVTALHESLRATRGAAVSVAEVRRTADGATIELCGVGNVVSALVSEAGSKALPSMNGTAGLQVRTLQSFTQPWTGGGMLEMHTDGITTRWRPDSYPGIFARDPALLAALISRDFTRGRDDATVLALALARRPDPR